MMKASKLKVDQIEISLISDKEEEFISLTDMARYRDAERTNYIIQNWMRTRSTIEFVGLWEQLHNPDFKSIEFDAFKNEAGSNSFALTPTRWIEATNAKGIKSKSGRYGGTYAHRDIAFEFASWLSPTFKLYLITDYQRVKSLENNPFNLEWNVKRLLSKTNYHLQTDAVQKQILPKKNYNKNNEWLAYAEEADLLNVALFDCTAKDWREANPELAAKNINIRDMASMNSVLILQNIEKPGRFKQLCQIADYQLNVLNSKETSKSIKKLDNNTLNAKNDSANKQPT